jgi:hypothetical protein
MQSTHCWRYSYWPSLASNHANLRPWSMSLVCTLLLGLSDLFESALPEIARTTSTWVLHESACDACLNASFTG